jgi:hypothetical protein
VQTESGAVSVAEAERSDGSEGNGTRTLKSGLLCADEIIYVGKLLKILRSGEKAAPPALKASIDAIMGVLYPEAHFGG